MINVKKLFFKPFIAIIGILPNKLSCILNNIRQKVMNRNNFFYYDENKKLFFVKDGEIKVYFNEKIRGIITYSYGVKERADTLAKTYSLNKIKFNKNDIFIDCGANYGDLYIWSLLHNLKLRYISFEPSPEEFNCIKLNCPEQTNNNIALSNKIGNFEFFIKSDTGDSSLIEPALGFKKKIKIKTITLEKYVLDNNLENIKFLKLEAEGFEPEVLMGSKNILNRIKYIGVDGGPERGKNMETTIEFASNFLLSNNFSIVSEKKTNLYIKSLFINKNFE